MSYYGQIPFNTNGGALLSKRNYINRKLDEIEQKLLQLGWIEPEPEQMYETEEITNEYNIPVESAGALLPYRDKVNKKLDFFEEVIQSHTGYNNSYDNYYTPQPKNIYNNPYSNPQPTNTYNNTYNNPYTQPKIQDEVKKSVDKTVASVFG